MKYLPFESFEICSSLTSAEVFYRLRAAVETKETWRILIRKPYRGKVNRTKLKIFRVTKWWERDNPATIGGEIRSRDSGCCLYIKIKLHWYGVVFFCIWLGYFWQLLFSGIINFITVKIQTGIWQYTSPMVFLGYGVWFAIGYLLLEGGFKKDVKHSKQFLANVVDVKLEDLQYVDKIFGLTESRILLVLLLFNIVGLVLAIAVNLFR